MAIEQGIWKIGDKPTKLKPVILASEEQIVAYISILNSNWLLIGRQVRTDFDKYIDLLGLVWLGRLSQNSVFLSKMLTMTAQKYGFVSAGRGRWYSNTLNMLDIGDRVLVKIP